jgi:hypothetical protein
VKVVRHGRGKYPWKAGVRLSEEEAIELRLRFLRVRYVYLGNEKLMVIWV